MSSSAGDVVSRYHRIEQVYRRREAVRMATTESLAKRPMHQTVEEHSRLFRDLLLGFVRVHVLYHASMAPVYGVGLISTLDEHGYRLSPGTLYPLLHSLERAGFLLREDRIVAGKVRKYYRITAQGRMVLRDARNKVIDLVNETTQSTAPSAP
jgi:DNA-binding PadR family transcriptional regulator